MSMEWAKIYDDSVKKVNLEFSVDYREETMPADVILCLTEHRPQRSIQKREHSVE
ncbi:hypothetical protein K0M31_001239 [Melipona bicolor]|uniref:Uncharacterized protein n=1 Tax=Melipona bicolor TaxID=60889 RepID=A0AA40KY04_9HYME|nr:hypothetical protein K0M31_001239 [Melipona bicolor]